MIKWFKKSNFENDIRFKILYKIRDEGKGTGEFEANEFLHDIHSDLGTIRRALLELIDAGYIELSNWPKELASKRINAEMYSNVKDHNLKSKEEIKDLKNSKRLIEPVGIYPKVAPLCLVITLSGIIKLIEFETSSKTNWLVKYHILINFCFAILGALIVFFADMASDILKERRKLSSPVEQISNQSEVETSSLTKGIPIDSVNAVLKEWKPFSSPSPPN